MTDKPTKFSPSNAIAPFPGNRRVFFGHQSVGSNILDGIQLLSPTSTIVEQTANNSISERPGISHALVGRNHDPRSKIDEFAEILTTTSAKYDIAMMKLCYVDISKDTDIQDLFQHYKSMVDKLAASVPGVRLVHLTVPLRSIRLGLRSRIKRLAGQSLAPVEDNIQREAYNSLLRSEYDKEHHFFDLAKLEATRPDGCASCLQYRSEAVRMLHSGYSDDGGHLNTMGKQVIARELMKLIDEL